MNSSGPDRSFRPVDTDALGVTPTRAEIDPTVPSTARIYDYWLGGKDNFAADRDAAERFIEVAPHVRDLARQNRGFMVRAAKLIAEAGVDQFIDLGTGIPTSPNVHEVVRETRPDARVVYVDNDPIVMAHNSALRRAPEGVASIEADIRHPHRVLDDPQLRSLIDFDRPVGLLGVAVMHFIVEDEIVAEYVRGLAPGSHVALSVASRVGMSEGERRRTVDSYRGTPINLRDLDQVTALFHGLELLEPGVVNMASWRAEEPELSPVVLAGVARVP